MKTSAQRILFFILLGTALLSLPACGSKGEVKSQTANETMLNADTTPMAYSSTDTGTSSETGHKSPVSTYTEKMGSHKNSAAIPSSTTSNPAVASTPMAVIPSTTSPTPSMETTAAPKKAGGSHFLLIIFLVLVVAGIGWYFWTKNQPMDDHPDHPMPPVGGLSPVSGFTAVKDKIEEADSSETSFWSKKLF